MNTVQILKEARALIANEKNWTQGEYALAENGRPQLCPNQFSKCFCSVGAVSRAMRLHPTEAGKSGVMEKFIKAAGLSNVRELVEFNDSHTHAVVLALFDRAIARAESEVA